ncbi:putative NADH oxidase [Podospora australis]|uniref:NADH oxidase n=1 Tax=Podospora australis TaxID=1536484 RepID=A0AAN6WKS1_9PEZI|nr:putative NADH oxidase [Podospora australis]
MSTSDPYYTNLTIQDTFKQPDHPSINFSFPKKSQNMTVTTSHKQQKRIIIAGGVAGGMSCATRLRRLDEFASITVLEKGPWISYANCGIPYALGGVISEESKLHVQTPEKIQAWFNVEVLTNTELVSINRADKTVVVKTPEGGNEMQYDVLVLALGAEPFVPPVPGLKEREGVFTLVTLGDLRGIETYLTQQHSEEKKKRNAVVIGGAFIGLEAAENLRLREDIDQVTVIEREGQVFPAQADREMVFPLQKELTKNGVKVHVNANITSVTSDSVQVEGVGEVKADLVIVAAGVRARMDIPQQAGLACGKSGVKVNRYMQTTSDKNIYAVGDMVETYHQVLGRDRQVALAGPANRQGRLAADHICGKQTKYRGNVGTSVCKVFEKAIGIVGASSLQLQRTGMRYESVIVHPVNHASYYPGSERLMVKILFDPESGRLLGGQVVGGMSGMVDKQTSVLATAIMGGMTVDDLEHLELAYAPPFGSAKDVVNMAGFVAGNLIRGDVEVVHASDFAEGRQKLEDYYVLDVRSPAEFAGGHVHGAVNINIGELRERLGEVDRRKKVLVYCAIGYRGYLGYRILKQEGYDVVNLDGGFRAVKEGGYDEKLQDLQV